MESPTMKKAYEEIQRLSKDPKTRALAISREINLKDQLQRENDARMDGKEEGREEGREEVILKMHKMHIPIETIAEATDTSIEKLKEIIEANIH